jgi:hypothetical protein
MPNQRLVEYLNQALVASEVFELRPDYRCLLIAVEGISPASSDEFSEALLIRAEQTAINCLTLHHGGKRLVLLVLNLIELEIAPKL